MGLFIIWMKTFTFIIQITFNFLKMYRVNENGVFARWRHLITTSGIISNLGLHVLFWETADSGASARYWLPNNTLKQHKALKSVTLEPIPVSSLHNRRFMNQARRMWHFKRSNVFLVEGLIVTLGKFCTSPVILRRKMAIDFYTYKLVLQNIISS